MRPAEYLRLDFGKHRGTAICDVPTPYLCWMMRELHDLREHLRDAIADELRCRRVHPDLWDSDQDEEPPERPRAGALVDWQAIITEVRRDLSRKWHPDKGNGDHQLMSGINIALDAIEARLSARGAA